MRLFLAALALAAAGCSSQSTVETKQVTVGEYYARGNLNVALTETRLAIKDDPTYMQAYNMQGLVYMELREDVMARQAFDQALRLQPNNAEVLNNFGWFLCTRNDTARGLELLQRAATDTMNATPEKVMLSTGLCYRRMGRNAEAEEYLRRAVLIRPDLIGALYNLALISHERGANQDAENYLNRYMRMATPTIDGLVLGVKVARAMKDKAAEDSYMQQLRRRYPDSPQTAELERRQ